MRDGLAGVIEKAKALEKAIDDFMGDLHTRASWDKSNIDADGIVTLPCGNGVLYRLREARAALAAAVDSNLHKAQFARGDGK